MDKMDKDEVNFSISIMKSAIRDNLRLIEKSTVYRCLPASEGLSDLDLVIEASKRINSYARRIRRLLNQ